jgi:uncharacterized protein
VPQAQCWTDARSRPSDRVAPLMQNACRSGIGAACTFLADGVRYQRDATSSEASKVRAALSGYQRACDLEDAEGCVRAGKILDDPSVGKRDHAGALALYERACVFGAIPVCLDLAQMYESGNNAPLDPSRAARMRSLGVP